MRVLCDNYCIEINGFDVHVMLRVIIFACICQRVYLGIIIHILLETIIFVDIVHSYGRHIFLWISRILVDVIFSCGYHAFLWRSYFSCGYRSSIYGTLAILHSH